MRAAAQHLRREAKVLFALLCAFAATASAAASAGRVLEANPENYLQLLSGLQPGDTLRLVAGEYRNGLAVHHLAGTMQAPIVIRGPASGEAAVFVARAGANTVSLVEAAYIHIRDLTLDGRNIPVDGVKAEGHSRWAHHITLENLTIVNHGAYQGNVGISTKCPAWGWVIRGNRIRAAGTGMYLGNSDGSGAFYAGVIENNLVTDARGYAIQIKHQHARPALDIAPRGRFVTVIRHNVLSKASGGSQGRDARPNLLVGHWPLSGEGTNDEYLIYGNLLHDNPHEALFQGEGNIAFYNNLLINPRGPGVHIQPHNDVPRSVRILHNTIITAGEPIVVRLSENPPTRAQFVAGNALFAPYNARGGVQSGNLAFAPERTAELLAAVDAATFMFDARPRDARLQCAPLDARLLEALPEAGCDFDGEARTQGYCGAYAVQRRNPAWLPALAVKPRTECRAR